MGSYLAMADFTFCSCFTSHRDDLPLFVHVVFCHLCFHLSGFHTRTSSFTCFFCHTFVVHCPNTFVTSKRLCFFSSQACISYVLFYPSYSHLFNLFVRTCCYLFVHVLFHLLFTSCFAIGCILSRSFIRLNMGFTYTF